MDSVPRGTRLHLDLDKIKMGETDMDGNVLPISTFPRIRHKFIEIFCTQKLPDFHWARNDDTLHPDDQPIKVYIPKGIMREDEAKMHRDELQDSGYGMETLPVGDLNKLLRSSFPVMTVELEPFSHTWA
jgi:hypothetical protein